MRVPDVDAVSKGNDVYMAPVTDILGRLRRDDGAVATEYAIVIMLVALFMIAAIILVRDRVVLLYELPPL